MVKPKTGQGVMTFLMFVVVVGLSASFGLMYFFISSESGSPTFAGISISRPTTTTLSKIIKDSQIRVEQGYSLGGGIMGNYLEVSGNVTNEGETLLDEYNVVCRALNKKGVRIGMGRTIYSDRHLNPGKSSSFELSIWDIRENEFEKFSGLECYVICPTCDRQA